jgi:hypothetical protein
LSLLIPFAIYFECMRMLPSQYNFAFQVITGIRKEACPDNLIRPAVAGTPSTVIASAAAALL